MDPWPRFIAAVLDRHGVADVALARSHGIADGRFFRRTRREGWTAPAPRVRVHPDAPTTVQRRLLVACLASSALVVASGRTAAWLHGLHHRPPPRPTAVSQYRTTVQPREGVRIGRSRWLSDEDATLVRGVPTLALPALLVAAGRDREREGWLIDAVHRGLTSPDVVLARAAQVTAVPGLGELRRQCHHLSKHRVESVFQADVAAELARLGYRPEPGTLEIPTSDGIGLTLDIALPIWQIAVEPDGDAFHRTREQRRLDRRRDAAFAATPWVRVPVDWRDWHLDRDHVLAAIDAAIEAQRRRGIGTEVVPPRRAVV